MSEIYKTQSGYSFDGEPRLCMLDGGTTIEVRGGQPVMDAGGENGALISLFTLPGWWGNYLLDKDNRIGESKFDEITGGPITRSLLIDSEREAAKSLKWRVSQKVSSGTDADISLDDNGALVATIKTLAPIGGEETIVYRKHGLNWVRQTTDPAHARLSDGYR